ncbi:MAG: hypothetical protein ACYTEZ_14085 [Planctomycetota bacterium]|jgi:hypothetical protein
MSRVTLLVLSAVVSLFIVGCDGGGKGGKGGDFLLIEFQHGNRDNIARNQRLIFVFSAPVAPVQNLAERIKIQNVQSAPQSDFTLAVGLYAVSGERVTFVPRLPVEEDRGDAGFRANANYHVFLKGGPDALTSAGGKKLGAPQEFVFETNEFFDDLVPDQPPRVLGLVVRDPSSGDEFDMSRLEPRPEELALLDSDALVQGGRILEPGGGGAPDYATPWEFELQVSEPLDPHTVIRERFQFLEIRHDALTDADSADPGHVGDPVSFPVPFDLELVQSVDATGRIDVRVHLRLVQPLLDDARYRLSFSGDILGLDFRKVFIGENGLTGDGLTGAEPGGLGYVTEFLVYDRPAIDGSRTITYDKVFDQILPEAGQTTLDAGLYNTALYDPVTDPGKAVGAGGAGAFDFGTGDLGVFVVSTGQTVTLDTGDTPNGASGNPFLVTDVDPLDLYSNLGLPTPDTIVWEPQIPTDFQMKSLTVNFAGTLEVIGVNPCRVLVQGLADIQGLVDAKGSPGVDGGTTSALPGGAAGPSGFAGGGNKAPDRNCNIFTQTPGADCTTFDKYLAACTPAQSSFPFTSKGEGPGRGNAGGEAYPMFAWPTGTGIYGSLSGTGGGGGSHASSGQAGEDRLNVDGDVGTAGPACAGGAVISNQPITPPPTPPALNYPNSGVVGVRGQPGPTYGDREADLIKMGGSGGGAGGSIHAPPNANGATTSTGGTGGGGGGHFEISAALGIRVTGGITVAGGAGGQGVIRKNTRLPQGGVEGTGWETISGSGGGGAGGTIRLVTTADIVLADGTVLDARGGAGGGAPDNPVNPPIVDCKSCNAGGNGGNGFIFLMDRDGGIEGLDPAEHGFNDDFAYGVLTTRSAIVAAITELFRIPAADPDYEALLASDVVGLVGVGQRIRIYASSAKPDLDDPRQPDLTSETSMFEVALVTDSGVTITGNLEDLNPSGSPGRDGFVRLRADFEYDDPNDAISPPFGTMDEITVRYSFNG